MIVRDQLCPTHIALLTLVLLSGYVSCFRAHLDPYHSYITPSIPKRHLRTCFAPNSPPFCDVNGMNPKLKNHENGTLRTLRGSKTADKDATLVLPSAYKVAFICFYFQVNVILTST